MPFLQDLFRPYARLATTNRLMFYGALSTLAVSLVTINAFKNHSNFYSVAVYLSRSNRSVMVLANFGVLCALLIGRGFQHLFFGSLRPAEVERLYDKIWFFLTESLLAFTIFRDEFDVSFAIMFGFLLFVKCFHWLLSFRIEWMDQVQYPGPNIWFHVRMNILFVFLWLLDTMMLCFAIENIITHGIGGVILFASEYAILMASALNSMSKYFIIFYDIRRATTRGGENAPVWENKSMYIFYVELATDFLKLVTYLTFFLVVLTFYGLPLNILRDIYITARSFFQRCRDLIRYRSATRNMDERYPNASEEELSQMNDRTCIICREEMQHRDPTVQSPAGQPHAGINDTPKKLPCGHVFHFHCLRSWLERQQSCPTCRRTVLETRPSRPNAGAEAQPQAPQPGAVPQAQVFGGVGGVGRPPRPGFGLVARFLGAAGEAPPALAPGQFPHGLDAFNPLIPNPLQHPQQAPFLPPQNPFGPWVPMQQQAPPPPVQVLQGFYIGNNWQPWGAPAPQQQQQPRVQLQGNVADTRVPPSGQATSPSQNLPATQRPAAQNSLPTQTPAPQDPPPTQSSVPQSQPPVQPLVPQDLPPTQPPTSQNTPQAGTLPTPTNLPVDRGVSSQPNAPREAAGLAALRRFNSTGSTSRTTATPVSGTQSHDNRPRENHGTSRPNNHVPSLIPLSPTATAQNRPTQPVSTAQGPASVPQNPHASAARPNLSQTPLTARPQRLGVPSLIPLFDPASTAATIVPPPNQRPNQTQYPNFPHGIRPRLHFPLNTNLPDLRSLPQTLTQEQLNRLDVVTREALDERIRLLENVQGALWRCADELVRIRSVLPPLATPARQNVPTASQAQPPATAPSATESTSDPYVVGTDATGGVSEDVPGDSTSTAALQAAVIESSSTSPPEQPEQPIVPAVSVEVTEGDTNPSVVPETVIAPGE